MSFRINTKPLLNDFLQHSKMMFEMHGDVTGDMAKTPKKRSLPQNDISHVWYTELARQGDMTYREYRNYCKLEFGMAIMLVGHEKQRDIWHKAMTALTFEERCESMTNINVTSTFNKKQMTQYLDEVQRHFTQERFILTSREK